MSTDAQPAASSPAATPTPTPVSGQAVLDSLTSEESQSFALTGTLPERVTIAERTPVDATPAASSPATPASQAASTDATPAPASEPGKPKGDKLKARNAQLDAENEALREKLRIRHALREELASLDRPKPDAKTDSSPDKPTQSEWQRYKALPGAPKQDDFESYDDFTAAQTLFITDQRWQEHQAKAREAGESHQRAASVQKLAEDATIRVRQYAETHPDFATKVDQRLLAVAPVSVLKPGAKIGPHNVLAEEIAKSPVTPQLLEHFSTDEGRADWSRMMTLPPTELLRAFGRIEERLERAASVATPPKHQSSAPAPATVLGTAPADTADPIEKAVREKDFERFRRETNKQALAAIGR